MLERVLKFYRYLHPFVQRLVSALCCFLFFTWSKTPGLRELVVLVVVVGRFSILSRSHLMNFFTKHLFIFLSKNYFLLLIFILFLILFPGVLGRFGFPGLTLFYLCCWNFLKIPVFPKFPEVFFRLSWPHLGFQDDFGQIFFSKAFPGFLDIFRTSETFLDFWGFCSAFRVTLEKRLIITFDYSGEGIFCFKNFPGQFRFPGLYIFLLWLLDPWNFSYVLLAKNVSKNSWHFWFTPGLKDTFVSSCCSQFRFTRLASQVVAVLIGFYPIDHVDYKHDI